jgi:hypothetical protein
MEGSSGHACMQRHSISNECMRAKEKIADEMVEEEEA